MTKSNYALALVAILSAFACKCSAFTLIHINQRFANMSNERKLIFKAHNDKYESDGKEFDSLKARTCVRQFLTQRSIQSFMFLLKECRDPHTARWIEEFGGAKNLLSYHGTGAFDFKRFQSWDSYLQELMQEPIAIVLVEIQTRTKARGLSANNPYRDKESSTVEFEIDIDPVSLASRILSVREQLGREWAEDLVLVKSANDQILNSYNQRIFDARKYEENLREIEEKDADEKFPEDFTDSSPDAVSSDADTSEGYSARSEKKEAFERAEIYMMNNHPSFNDMAASPLRRSNFDLLFLLSTQESIHRVLLSYIKAGNQKEISFAWLRNHYELSLENFFDGNQRFGRANDFLDDLLLTPPSLKNTEDGKVGLIDPLAIAEDIIRVRGDVVMEWKAIMSTIPNDHTGLRQELFVKQMAKWGQRVEEDKEVSPIEEISGDFE